MNILIFVFMLMAVTMAGNMNTLITQSNTNFTAKFFHEISKSKSSGSWVTSAFSVIPPLAQLAMASESPSRDEIIASTYLPIRNDQIISTFLFIVNKLRNVHGVELKMASKVYVTEEAQINPQFRELSRNVFHADIERVDFSQNHKTALNINSWVARQTANRITDLVDPASLTDFTKAILVNAIYFKAKWMEEFNPTTTKNKDFYLSPYKSVKRMMMQQTNKFHYTFSLDLDAQILKMVYSGGDASFVIILPNQIDGVNRLVERMREDPQALLRAMRTSESTYLEVVIPKFKIETTTKLVPVLQKLGIQKLFTPYQAELTQMLENYEDLYINEVTQKAFIEIDESGTEAAVANEFDVFFATASLPELKVPQRFIADHPFVFNVMVDELTLFSGVYKG